MNADFNWWLLIVGLVVGAALVWLVVADSNRREADLLDEELPSEATWISEALADEGVDVEAGTVERILRLHRAYLAVPPPDEPDPELDRVVTGHARFRCPAGCDGFGSFPRLCRPGIGEFPQHALTALLVGTIDYAHVPHRVILWCWPPSSVPYVACR